MLDGTQSWREAVCLLIEVVRDPSSHLAAAIARWDHPYSREAFILADLYDLTQAAHVDRKHRSQLKAYPRPTGDPDRGKSKRPTVSQATVRAALAARGHGRLQLAS